MRIDVVAVFPEIIEAATGVGIVGRARKSCAVEINAWQLRDWSHDPHHKVDDYQYGGGVGMVLKPEPIFEAVEDICHRESGDVEGRRIILLSPQGKRFDQTLATALSRQRHLILICGRYEGVDERVRQHLITDEISIGDFITTGGEAPALAVIEAVVRLLPGVLTKKEAVDEETFSRDTFDWPHYTRPPDYKGMKVPDVLVSGNHEAINKWRREQARKNTYTTRPDLLNDWRKK